ncbi:MAG TPA: tRNA 2-thiouridine(34) synthase MnmA [bacterium]|jgi:tRNA-specific 2-thiouridylase
MNFDYKNRLSDGARILVAMSGGVDSSVTTYLLQQAGYDITGITMHLVTEEFRPVSGAQTDADKACCSLSMAEDARRVSSELDFPYYVLNLAEEFTKDVVMPSRVAYSLGRTPNPCILCNRHMKFDVLFERAEALGCDFVATGHYAKIGVDESGYHLYRGLDRGKDQSYFLAYLTQEELAKTIFPLGEMGKGEVRRVAFDAGLKVAARPESQDLCFFASGEPPDEWRDGIASAGGEIVTTRGAVIGSHSGISGFTIGQRKGLPGGMPVKMYVVEIDPDANRIVVGTEDELFSREFEIGDISLVAEKFADEVFEIQIRYRSKPVKGKVKIFKDGKGKVELVEPVRAVTPGQAAVWYSGDKVIGAATIESVVNLEKSGVNG